MFSIKHFPVVEMLSFDIRNEDIVRDLIEAEILPVEPIDRGLDRDLVLNEVDALLGDRPESGDLFEFSSIVLELLLALESQVPFPTEREVPGARDAARFP